MPGDRKLSGFTQGLYDVSSTKKERFGALRETEDGRTFRYAKAGGTLVAGKNTYGAVGVANHIKQANTGYTMAVGATSVQVLVGATAVTANQYDDGYLQIYDGTAGTVGTQYLINSHTTSSAGSEAITLFLAEPIRVAVIATDTFSLVPHPYSSVIQQDTLAYQATGIPVTAVTSAYYCWIQTGGLGCSLNQANTALGSVITASTTSGATQTAAGYTSMFMGVTTSFANVTTKYNPVWLLIK